MRLSFARNVTAMAVIAHNSGRAWRHKAQMGIEPALSGGLETIRNLGAIVANVLRGDAVGLGHWEGARRIEGMRRRRAPAAARDDSRAADRAAVCTGTTGTTGDR